MNEIKKQMIERAQSIYHRIYPCAKCASLEDSFTLEGKKMIFWFNTEDHSTHLVVENLSF